MNWQDLIGELSQLGYSQPQIAEKCGCGQATVSDLARGITANPSFKIGKGLTDLLKRARREAKQKSGAPTPVSEALAPAAQPQKAA